jgi:hypothetical protein
VLQADVWSSHGDLTAALLSFALAGSFYVTRRRDQASLNRSATIGYGWTIEVIGIHFPAEISDYLLSTLSRPVVEPTELRQQWIPVVLPSGVKGPECDADSSPQSSAEVEMHSWELRNINIRSGRTRRVETEKVCRGRTA